MRIVESSIKSCEKLLYYACKKGVAVMSGVRNSGSPYELTRNIQFGELGLRLLLLKSFEV